MGRPKPAPPLPPGGDPDSAQAFERRNCQRCFQQPPKRKTRQLRPPTGLLRPAGQACPGVGHPRRPRSLRGAGGKIPPTDEGDGRRGSTRPCRRPLRGRLGWVGLLVGFYFFVVVVFHYISPLAQARSRPDRSPRPRRRAGERGGGGRAHPPPREKPTGVFQNRATPPGPGAEKEGNQKT